MRIVNFCSVVFGVTARLPDINKINLCVALRRPSTAINKCRVMLYNLYSAVEMLTTLDDPAVINAKAKYWSKIAIAITFGTEN